MGKEPKFSVVVPTYNREAVLQKTIDSVLAQTCQDFELIIVDDGSTDNTDALVAEIKDTRIRYIHQTNGGGSNARNTGIDAAAGKYVAFLDSDDIFFPHHLGSAIDALESGSAICTYTQIIVDRGNGVTFLKPPRALMPNEHISEYLLRGRGFVPTITLIVPLYLARLVRYDEKISTGQDYDFALRIACAGGKLKMLPAPGARWNDAWDPNRLSSKKKPEQRIAWLQRIRPIITNKAYWSDMGWPVARGFAEQGKMLKAICLYFSSLLRGSYRPKVAIVVFLQIVLPKQIYRCMADALARYGVKP